MRPSALAPTLLLPLLALAQSQSQSQPPSQSQSPSQSQNNSQPQPSLNVITSTSLSAFVTLGPNRQISSGTSTLVFTLTQTITPGPAASSNGTVSGNSTVSANTTTTPLNLPTAPTNVNGGGFDGAAPSPGQTGVGGIFGPPDGYIAAATALKRSVFTAGFVGLGLGVSMLLF